MHAFWLFNAGAFAGEGKRGKDNHALLIVIDPVRRESAIVPGYGLESLLKQEALDHLLEMSGPAFQANKWEAGLLLLLAGLEQLLETVAYLDEKIRYGENDF
ncbi:MAG: TPM domain-containing protein [Armatimonadetes bacterium]|nr:TPM domain-containing protein [Akkermansiaceae bacterium]